MGLLRDLPGSWYQDVVELGFKPRAPSFRGHPRTIITLCGLTRERGHLCGAMSRQGVIERKVSGNAVLSGGIYPIVR